MQLFDTITLSFDFKVMAYRHSGGHTGKIRRLSTPSYVYDDSSSKNYENKWMTYWVWYFKLENKVLWELYPKGVSMC